MARKKKPYNGFEKILTAIGLLWGLDMGITSFDHTHNVFLFVMIFVGILAGAVLIGTLLDRAFQALVDKIFGRRDRPDPKKKNRTPHLKKSTPKIKSAHTYMAASSDISLSNTNSLRTDADILQLPIRSLTWQEFERLLALYFRDHGYHVEETGIGGKDGGVDLILINKRNGERTAVQIKHWADHRPVGPDVIRETHSARMNVKPSCHFAQIITSADVTQQARDEADARHMVYWHGAMLEHKLSAWPKWSGNTKSKSIPRKYKG